MCGCVSIELVGWKLSSVCFVLQFARSVNILSLFWCRQGQESSRLALLVGQEQPHYQNSVLAGAAKDIMLLDWAANASISHLSG